MLVIARRAGETILVGDDVEITISAIRGDQVRLAIRAPRSVTIQRKEAAGARQVTDADLAAIARDNEAAIGAAGNADLNSFRALFPPK
jgi:carbon storage regulator